MTWLDKKMTAQGQFTKTTAIYVASALNYPLDVRYAPRADIAECDWHVRCAIA